METRNKKCLRSIKAVLVQNSKGLFIKWIIHYLMATIAPILVIIQQMVYKLVNEQFLGEDK